jgi:hypothetical protein
MDLSIKLKAGQIQIGVEHEVPEAEMSQLP